LDVAYLNCAGLLWQIPAMQTDRVVIEIDGE
jgi:hypothetical protein